MARYVVVFCGVLILGLINISIWQKEQHLAHGEIVVLQLAPVDPRSLLQGDYMALDYVISQQIRRTLFSLQRARSGSEKAQTWSDPGLVPTNSYVVVALGEHQLASFVRLDDGQPLAENQRKLQFRVRKDRIKFATNAFFFAEGDEPVYRNAKYGEFRLNNKGEVLLTSLLDENFSRLQPPSI